MNLSGSWNHPWISYGENKRSLLDFRKPKWTNVTRSFIPIYAWSQSIRRRYPEQSMPQILPLVSILHHCTQHSPSRSVTSSVTSGCVHLSSTVNISWFVDIQVQMLNWHRSFIWNSFYYSENNNIHSESTSEFWILTSVTNWVQWIRFQEAFVSFWLSEIPFRRT